MKITKQDCARPWNLVVISMLEDLSDDKMKVRIGLFKKALQELLNRKRPSCDRCMFNNKCKIQQEMFKQHFPNDKMGCLNES